MRELSRDQRAARADDFDRSVLGRHRVLVQMLINMMIDNCCGRRETKFTAVTKNTVCLLDVIDDESDRKRVASLL